MLVALLLPGGVRVARAAEDGDGWTVRDQRVTHPLKAGTPVCITNLVGDVRVREVADPVLTVVAMIQQRRGDPRVPLIEKGDQHPCLVQATVPGAAPEGLYPPGRAPRVDLTVFVPPGSPVFITTAAGRIEAKGLAGDVTAHSDSGNVFVRTPGLIAASSRLGNVEVFIRKFGKGRAYRISSEAGEVSVHLPATGAACVTAETTGQIASDYTMSVRRAADSAHKRARIEVGTSRLGRWLFGWTARRTTVELGSEQGDVRVRAPFPEMREP
jgi:hypothetical protein